MCFFLEIGYLWQLVLFFVKVAASVPVLLFFNSMFLLILYGFYSNKLSRITHVQLR